LGKGKGGRRTEVEERIIIGSLMDQGL